MSWLPEISSELRLHIWTTAWENWVSLEKQIISVNQSALFHVLLCTGTLNSVLCYLKKDLVAHCETSLSLAALEHARISAVAQACSSWTRWCYSLDWCTCHRVKPHERKKGMKNKNTLCSLKNRSISSLSPPAQLTNKWRSWSTGRNFWKIWLPCRSTRSIYLNIIIIGHD